jgi:hypothetical protein
MQKARGQAFRLPGIALVGVLPIFRSRYSFAIGRQRVLSLAGWAPRIQTHFHVLSRTQDTTRPSSLPLTGLSPSMAGHSRPFC